MKSIFLTSIGDHEKKVLGTLELKDVPKPIPGPEDVLIRIAYASICGSDAHVMRGNLGPIREFVLSALPMRLGHEISGVIEDMGEKAAAVGFKKGDRITGNYTHFCNSCYYCRTGRENFCRHPEAHFDGMSEYVCWNMSQVFKIPDDVSLLDASQTEPLSIALNSVQTVNVRFGSRVAIFGGGSIGLMAAQLAKLAGAELITVFEIVEDKRNIALKCGANFAINPLDADWKEQAIKHTNGMGYDSVIESSGASSAAQSVLDILSVDGHAVFFAMYDPSFELKINPFIQLYMQQKHIHGMYTSADAFPKTISMLRSVNFDYLIQKVYKLEEYQKAFEDQLSGKYAKLVFEVSGDK